MGHKQAWRGRALGPYIRRRGRPLRPHRCGEPAQRPAVGGVGSGSDRSPLRAMLGPRLLLFLSCGGALLSAGEWGGPAGRAPGLARHPPRAPARGKFSQAFSPLRLGRGDADEGEREGKPGPGGLSSLHGCPTLAEARVSAGGLGAWPSPWESEATGSLLHSSGCGRHGRARQGQCWGLSAQSLALSLSPLGPGSRDASGGPQGAARGRVGGLVGLEVKSLRRDPGSTGSWLRTDKPRCGLWASVSRSVQARATPPFCVAAGRIEDLGGWKGPLRPSAPSLTHQAVGTGVPFLLPQVPSANSPRHSRRRRPRRRSPRPRPPGGASPKGSPDGQGGSPFLLAAGTRPRAPVSEPAGLAPACLIGPCPAALSLVAPEPHQPQLGAREKRQACRLAMAQALGAGWGLQVEQAPPGPFHPLPPTKPLPRPPGTSFPTKGGSEHSGTLPIRGRLPGPIPGPGDPQTWTQNQGEEGGAREPGRVGCRPASVVRGVALGSHGGPDCECCTGQGGQGPLHVSANTL